MLNKPIDRLLRRNPSFKKFQPARSVAGIDKPITLHTFRHTFATDLYQDTSKIRLVHKALGHANLATTEIHKHIDDEELEEELKSFRKAVFAA
jgi:integrase/recombinase XerD